VLELRIDGAPAAAVTGATGIDTSTDVPAVIGSLAGGSVFRVDGDIDEIIAVEGAGATTHLGVVEDYLTTKYGL
jgi:hypothetical protein